MNTFHPPTDAEGNNAPELVSDSIEREGDSSDACLENSCNDDLSELSRATYGSVSRRPTVRQLCEIVTKRNPQGYEGQRYSEASRSCDNVHDEPPHTKADGEHYTEGTEEFSSASQPDPPDNEAPNSYNNADDNHGPDNEAHGESSVEESKDLTHQFDVRSQDKNSANGECAALRDMDPRIFEEKTTHALSQGTNYSTGNNPSVARTFSEDGSGRGNRKDTHGRAKTWGLVADNEDAASGRNQRGNIHCQSMETRTGKSGIKGNGSQKRYSMVPGGVASPRTAAGSAGAPRAVRRKRSQLKLGNTRARNGGEEEAAEETLDNDVVDQTEEHRNQGTKLSPAHHKHGHSASLHFKVCG